MAKSMEDRVRDAMGEDVSEAFLLQLLDVLRANQQEATRELRRTSAPVLLLVLAFVLLNNGGISQATVLSFRVDEVTFLTYLIPPSVAYLLLQVPLLLQDFISANRAHDAVIAGRYPSVYRQDLEVLLAPPSNTWIQARKLQVLHGRPGRSTTAAVYFLGLGTVLLPALAANLILTFLVVTQFVYNGLGNWAAWLSCLATVGLGTMFHVTSAALADAKQTATPDATASPGEGH